MEREYYIEQLHRVNCLGNDMNALYHQAARRLGISDSALRILYAVQERGDRCLLHDVCRDSGLSKQTINSAIRGLEKQGVLYLEQDGGKKKRICLTDAGRAYMQRTAGCLLEAESNAFAEWTQQEFAVYLNLLEKYNRAFEKQVQKLGRDEA